MIAHIRAQGYEVLDRAPTIEERRRFPRIATVTHDAWLSCRADAARSSPRAIASGGRSRGGPLVVLPSLGGSLPLYVIREELGAPTVTLGLWNHDNNQHAEDENVRIGNLMNGIVAIATA